MTITDTDELTERIARALDKNFNPGRYPIMAAMFMDYAAAILPEVEAEVRKAKAEALRAAAHDYWAEHEPTDAEVEAGEESIDCLFGWGHLRRYGGQSEEWMDRLRKAITHNVLSAARAARRDEEKRDD